MHLGAPQSMAEAPGGVRGGQTLLGVSPLLRPLTRGPQAPGSDAASGGAPLQKRGRPRDGLADCSAPPSTCSRPPSSLREQVLRGGLIPAPARSSAQLPALCGPEKTLTLAVEATAIVWLPQTDSPPQGEGRGRGRGAQAGAPRVTGPRERHAQAPRPRAPGLSLACSHPLGTEGALPPSELAVTLTGRWRGDGPSPSALFCVMEGEHFRR